MALRLHAITLADAPHQANAPATDGNGTQNGTVVVPFRDLVAVVTEQRNFGLDEPTPGDAERHRAIVDAVFHRSAVLPAPVGAVFRSPDVLKRWMELHYVSLTDALEFVDDRAVARVHIVRADGKDEDLETGSDLAAAAAESFRALRRRSVAAVPLRLEEITGLVLSAAFLVERDLWKDFAKAVEEQHDAHRLLRFDVTGPWAPYDFVRMQFGG
ncbi:MAG TPA: GvpL/GvpF family gas vesicle protein [Gemmatimonadaceae bacterium]|nr:GvpL/GvpF family gas vesicle protein [Gemmatimonadaceae bacterium]